jgi:hypothetical protein
MKLVSLSLRNYRCARINSRDFAVGSRLIVVVLSCSRDVALPIFKFINL